MKFIRVYCGVKYEDKDVAKSLGFRYDQEEKKKVENENKELDD